MHTLFVIDCHLKACVEGVDITFCHALLQHCLSIQCHHHLWFGSQKLSCQVIIVIEGHREKIYLFGLESGVLFQKSNHLLELYWISLVEVPLIDIQRDIWVKLLLEGFLVNPERNHLSHVVIGMANKQQIVLLIIDDLGLIVCFLEQGIVLIQDNFLRETK